MFDKQVGVKRDFAFFIAQDAPFDDERVDRAALLVHVVLCKYAHGKYECWPSMSTIAKDARCGRATVKRALKKLVQLGYIRKRRRASDSGDPSSNLYILQTIVRGVGSPQTPPRVTADPRVGSPETHELDSSYKDKKKENATLREGGALARAFDGAVGAPVAPAYDEPVRGLRYWLEKSKK